MPGPGSYENESDRYGLGSTCVLQVRPSPPSAAPRSLRLCGTPTAILRYCYYHHRSCFLPNDESQSIHGCLYKNFYDEE